MTPSAHLVGSLPGVDAEDAMDAALGHLAPHLRSLPDGETGDRRNWIIHIIEALRTPRCATSGSLPTWPWWPGSCTSRCRSTPSGQPLAHLSARTGRPIDVATSCGLGRRDRTHADAAMEVTAALCGPGG